MESKSIFWKHFFEKGIYCVQNLLNRDGKFLSLENFQRKYNFELNNLKYFQLIAAIPNCSTIEFEEESTGEIYLRNWISFICLKTKLSL